MNNRTSVSVIFCRHQFVTAGITNPTVFSLRDRSSSSYLKFSETRCIRHG